MLLAGSSLLTLLDDIATLLDDISVMGKLAAKKTAGVLGMIYHSMHNKFQVCVPTGNFPWSGEWRKDR